MKWKCGGNVMDIKVLLSIPEAFVDRDIMRKDGKGTFNVVKLPKGTVIDGKDLSYYRLVVDKAFRDDNNKAAIPLSSGRNYKLVNSVKGEDGQYHEKSEWVSGYKITEAIEQSNERYKESKKEREK